MQPCIVPGFRVFRCWDRLFRTTGLRKFWARVEWGLCTRPRDLHLNRFAAVKVLPRNRAIDPDRRRRFVHEARTASGLNHPNIVAVYDLDTVDGTDFIAMEYVAGHPLGHLIEGKGLPLKDALHYAIQIADALGNAHSVGIVHRDLKPANVVVTPSGVVKLLDFGLAKLTEGSGAGELAQMATMSASDSPNTEPGGIVGTVAYMSPEQAEGKQVDSRSDIFSFGSVLYQMVTGSRPFKGDSAAAILVAVLSKEPDAPGQIVKTLPPELDKIILRCLRKDPARRFHSILDVKVELEELASASHPLQPAAGGRKRIWPSRMHWATAAVAILVFAATGWLLFRNPTQSHLHPMTVPLTSYPGIEREPSFSPDGNQVAFAWDGDQRNHFDIYVKMVGSGSPLRLTTHRHSAGQPAWSPDGTQIAFLRDGGLAVDVVAISPLGDPERTLARLTGGLPSVSWSPDGKYLAVAKDSREQAGGVFLLAVETGELHRLTTSANKSWNDWLPALSPDGRTLAFVRVRGHSSSDIYVLDIAGVNPQGEPRQITFDGRYIRGLDWSTDGKSIVFSSDREVGQTLWRVPASGGAIERLSVGADNSFRLSIARRQSRLAYAQYVFDSNIWRIPGPGTHQSGVTAPQKLIASTRTDSSPQYSPSGRNVVFTSRRSGPPEIWLSDAEGSRARQLTNFGGPALGNPRWSPDGTRVAFDSTKQGNLDIYIIPADGGMARQLTTDVSEETRPSWSGDGRWIYFGSNRSGDWQIWKAPVDGGPSIQVTKQGGYEAYESFDGRFVYYCKEMDSGLWQVETSGGEEAPLTPRGQLGGWIPTRHGIVFFTHDSGKEKIELFDTGTRRSTRIIAELPETITIPFGASTISVSPDGAWILYTQNDPSAGDILLVENFR